MPFDAGGNFTRVHNWQEDRDNGIRIMADRHDEEDDNLANGLNQTFLRTGVVPMTGNLQMNGHRVIDVASGTLLQPGLTFELDNDTGYNQPGSGQLGVVINQVLMGLWTDSGLDVHGDITVDGISIGSGGGTIGDTIDIPGSITTEDSLISSRFATPGQAILRRAEGTKAAPTAIATSQNLGVMYGMGYDGAAYQQTGYIAFASKGAVTPADSGGRITFGTTPAGTVVPVERMIIGADGTVTVHSNLSVTGSVSTNGNLTIERPDTDYAILGIHGLRDYDWQSYPASLYGGGGLRLVDVTGGIEIFNVKADGTTVFNYPINFGNAALFANGSATAPGIRFADNDSGLYQTGDGVLGFSINGVETLKLSSGTAAFGAAVNVSANAFFANYFESTGNVRAKNDLVADSRVLATGAIYPRATLTGNAYYLSASASERVLNWGGNHWMGWLTASGDLRFVQNGVQTMLHKQNGDTIFARDLSVSNTLFVGNLGVFNGVGLNAGIKIVNNNIGHDYRVICKDDAALSITNESQSWAYMRFTHDTGQIWAERLLVMNRQAILWRDQTNGRDHQIFANGDMLHVWNSIEGDRLLFHGTMVRPSGDNNMQFGGSGFRWGSVWCVSSSNTTSDEREKDWIGPLSEAELACGADMSKEIGTFRWKDGTDDNTIQVGLRAQKVIAIFEAHGLDWNDYGCIRHDTWEESVTYGPGTVDEDGNPVMGEPIVTPGGDRYSVRLPELALFIAASQEQRIAKLEAMIVP